MTRASKIAQLLTIISTLQTKLDELRSGCNHTGGYHVGNWSWRVGCLEVRRICNTCQMPTKDPVSNEELVEFRLEERNQQKEFLEDQGDSPEEVQLILNLHT